MSLPPKEYWQMKKIFIAFRERGQGRGEREGGRKGEGGKGVGRERNITDWLPPILAQTRNVP